MQQVNTQALTGCSTHFGEIAFVAPDECGFFETEAKGTIETE